MALDPVTGSLISGIGGSVLSGLFGRSSAKRQINFQERMATTAHQREARDLSAAGLNRILGVSGSGGPSPGGAMPATPDFASSALAAMRLKAEIKLIKANTDLTDKKTETMTPISDIMGGIGAVTTPLADSFEQIVNDLPNSAKAVKPFIEKVKDYLFEKRHKSKPFHGRGEIKR